MPWDVLYRPESGREKIRREAYEAIVHRELTEKLGEGDSARCGSQLAKVIREANARGEKLGKLGEKLGKLGELG